MHVVADVGISNSTAVASMGRNPILMLLFGIARSCMGETMGVFKHFKCRNCGLKREVADADDKQNAPNCPRCGDGKTYYSTRWYYRFTEGGRKKISAGSTSKKKTETLLGAREKDIIEGKVFDLRKPTSWKVAKERFVKWVDAHVPSDDTRRSYKNGLKNLEKNGFSNFNLHEINEHAVTEFVLSRKARKRTNSTINRDIGALKRLLNKAVEWKMLEKSPLEKLKPLPENNPRIRELSYAEEEKLMKALADKVSKNGKIIVNRRKMRLGYLLAVSTGLRKEGVMTATWPAMSMERRMIRAKVKGGETLDVPMANRLYEELKLYKTEREEKGVDSNFLFPGRRDSSKAAYDFHKGFGAALRRANIKDFRWHDIRHTFACRFWRRTKDWKALQMLLGHSDVRITMRHYVHLLQEDLQESMRKYEEEEARQRERGTSSAQANVEATRPQGESPKSKTEN